MPGVLDVTTGRGQKVIDALIQKNHLVGTHGGATEWHLFRKQLREIVEHSNGPQGPVFPKVEPEKPNADGKSDEWYFQLIRPVSQVRILPWIASHLGGGKGDCEVLRHAKPLGRKTKVPETAVTELEAAWQHLQQTCSTGQVAAKNFANSFLLPNPDEMPGQYRLYGPPWKRRLTVLWGYRPKNANPSVQISPEAALAKLRDKKRLQSDAWVRALWLGIIPAIVLGTVMGLTIAAPKLYAAYINYVDRSDLAKLDRLIVDLDALREQAGGIAKNGGSLDAEAGKFQSDVLRFIEQVRQNDSTVDAVKKKKSSLEECSAKRDAVKKLDESADKPREKLAEITTLLNSNNWRDKAVHGGKWSTSLAEATGKALAVAQLFNQEGSSRDQANAKIKEAHDTLEGLRTYQPEKFTQSILALSKARAELSDCLKKVEDLLARKQMIVAALMVIKGGYFAPPNQPPKQADQLKQQLEQRISEVSAMQAATDPDYFNKNGAGELRAAQDEIKRYDKTHARFKELDQ